MHPPRLLRGPVAVGRLAGPELSREHRQDAPVPCAPETQGLSAAARRARRRRVARWSLLMKSRFDELLPFYVNGSLPPADREWVDAYLREHPRAVGELDWYRTLQTRL